MMEQVLEDMAAATDLRAIILRYFNPIGSDPDLESGIYVQEPSPRARSAGDGRAGQKDAFTITGTEHPDPRRHRHPRLRPRLGPGPGPRARGRALRRRARRGRRAERDRSTSAPATGVTVRELVAAFERVFGQRGADRRGRRRGPATRRVRSPNVDRSAELLGWRTELTIEDAIASALAWAREAPGDPGVRMIGPGRLALVVGVLGQRCAAAGRAGVGAVRPPPAPSAPVAAPGPLAGRLVVIDPGHQLGNHNFPRRINRPVPAGGFTKPCNTTGTATQRRLPGGDLRDPGGPHAA